MEFKRPTAYIFWINDMINAVPELTQEGARAFKIRGKSARRVNIIAAVIDVYENEGKTYRSVTLDDGSGQIRVKAWEEDTAKLLLNPGDIVIVVGFLHESLGEIFIRPEFARHIRAEWAVTRKEYLASAYGKPSAGETLKVSEESINNPVEPTMEARGKMLSLIAEYPESTISVEELIKKAGLAKGLSEKVIKELTNDGEIFSPRAGFVQAL
ncbi:MAG: hypothetical protein KJ955_05630 [Nanoarchaeota archaeon]|nr:hypothetical protein [Nanoarchaeota archaeon]